MISATVEDYLKKLYIQQQTDPDALVLMGSLATAMGVVPGTATSMVKSLSESKLVSYEPRGGVKLTKKGERAALSILRRHRLVELFLVEILGLDWSEVHQEAEKLEHVISDQVLDRMDALLGYPTVDPHGDPIPNAKGELHNPKRRTLSECKEATSHKIARVLDQDPAFLRFIDKNGLMPGATVKVNRKEKAADAMRIETVDNNEISLGLSAAAKIQVES